MRPRLVVLAWLLTDLLLFPAGYALAYFVRVGWIFSTDFPFAPYIGVAAAVAPLWLAVLVSTGIFRLTKPQQGLPNLLALLYAGIVGNALFALTYYFLNGLFFSRLLLVEALLLSTILLRAWHLIFERIGRGILARNPPAFPTLIVGVTRESGRLVALLRHTKNPLQPVAILDGKGSPEKEVEGVPVLGKLDKLEDTLRAYGITHLVQCSDIEQSLNLLSACRARGITYVLLPSVLGIVERDERTDSLEGCVVTVVAPPKKSWRSLGIGI
ncbi:MAG: hypothetical protein PHW10_03000 [Candidatus Peribacteraceae bacterium]|nr:hypothetical protein [Candidatus Peribacteraceae bacterium]